MPDIVVQTKSTLDIALCVNAGMNAINSVQGQKINQYQISQYKSRYTI